MRQIRKPWRMNTQGWASHPASVHPDSSLSCSTSSEKPSLRPLAERAVIRSLESSSRKTQSHPRISCHYVKMGHFCPWRHCRVPSQRRRDSASGWNQTHHLTAFAAMGAHTLSAVRVWATAKASPWATGIHGKPSLVPHSKGITGKF